MRSRKNCDYCGGEFKYPEQTKKDVWGNFYPTKDGYYMPFKCPHCKGIFCVEHRLPENHNCAKWAEPPFSSPKTIHSESTTENGFHQKDYDDVVRKDRIIDYEGLQGNVGSRFSQKDYDVTLKKEKITPYLKIAVVLSILIIGAYSVYNSSIISDFIGFIQTQTSYITSTTSSSSSFTLTILVSSKCSTNPQPGTHSYSKGTTVNITAISAPGWYFDHWTLDGNVIDRIKHIVVSMNNSHTLFAVFKEILLNQVDPNTGTYREYYIGLVKTPEGVISDSYGDFVVLINNKNANNPTYSQLLEFLRRDKTDQYPYKYSDTSLGYYVGDPESYVNFTLITGIINGTKQSSPPRICSDFAQLLHNSAEIAGIRCAYVSIDVGGSGHALNAFNTTDRGMVYIDDTGIQYGIGPSNCDKLIETFKVGSTYIPKSLFPESGWNIYWENIGTVTSIFLTWDGNWYN